MKQIPQALEHPLNVLKSDTKNDSIVVVTELADKNGDIVVASIKIDGKGTINDIRIDSNVMTSAYGKSGNYDYFMKDNISKGNLLYDIDEGILQKINSTQKKSDVKDRLQLPMRDSNSNTISDIPKNISPIDISNISQSDNNVKLDTLPKYSMQNNENNTLNNVKKGDMLPTYSQIKETQRKSSINEKVSNEFIKTPLNKQKKTTKYNDISVYEEFGKKIAKENGFTKGENTRSWSETMQKSQVLDQNMIK